MYAIWQTISKAIMPLKKSIPLPLHNFIRKASPSRQRLVIPETCVTHSGTDRPRGQKNRPTRHGDCGLALNLAPNSSASHESVCGIEKGSGWGSRQYKFPRNKSKRSRKGIVEELSYRLCRGPMHRARQRAIGS